MLQRVLYAVALAASALIVAGPADATRGGGALPSVSGLNRTFTISGNAGEAFTAYTVTGQLTLLGVPINVQVMRTGTGVVESLRAGSAALLGASQLHAGYVAWDITGPNPDENTYTLHAPRILPGGGGFFDADLEIEFAGGANGGLQIPMFDGTIAGGPLLLSIPGPRTFTCTGNDAEVVRTVTGHLSFLNVPRNVTVLETGSGIVDSSINRAATRLGPSWLHPGFIAWDITGPNPNGDVFILHVPAVLPPGGGFFDGDLEVQLAGGADGSLQIPMFDCTTRY